MNIFTSHPVATSIVGLVIAACISAWLLKVLVVDGKNIYTHGVRFENKKEQATGIRIMGIAGAMLVILVGMMFAVSARLYDATFIVSAGDTFNSPAILQADIMIRDHDQMCYKALDRERDMIKLEIPMQIIDNESQEDHYARKHLWQKNVDKLAIASALETNPECSGQMWKHVGE